MLNLIMGKRTALNIRNVKKVVQGFLSAIRLNAIFAKARFKGKKIVIFQLHAANQLPHIENVLRRLFQPPYSQYYLSVILCYDKELKHCGAYFKERRMGKTLFGSYYSTSLLLFWNIVFAVDQRMRLPLLNFFNGKRICIYHGQPTKGNVYKGFNYKGFDGLFFYGPLMRDYYIKERSRHPEWPRIFTWDIGQPKTDSLFLANENLAAREALGIVNNYPTIIYAPSFESCASLASRGKEIINALLGLKVNVMVKPHPSFYRKMDTTDAFFSGVPHTSEWINFDPEVYEDRKFIFPMNEQLDTSTAIQAADVMVTDHSGIAFEGFLLDKPVVFFDCPKFFDEYLPAKFGVDGRFARQDIACNAGRECGIVVQTERELAGAVLRYLSEPNLHGDKRAAIRKKLLFNPGKATDMFLSVLDQILEAK